MSQQLFKDWKEHSITKAVWEYLEVEREAKRTMLEGEANIREPHFDRISAKLIGAIQIITNLLNIDYEEVAPTEEGES